MAGRWWRYSWTRKPSFPSNCITVVPSGVVVVVLCDYADSAHSLLLNPLVALEILLQWLACLQVDLWPSLPSLLWDEFSLPPFHQRVLRLSYSDPSPQSSLLVSDHAVPRLWISVGHLSPACGFQRVQGTDLDSVYQFIFQMCCCFYFTDDSFHCPAPGGMINTVLLVSIPRYSPASLKLCLQMVTVQWTSYWNFPSWNEFSEQYLCYCWRILLRCGERFLA